MNKRQKKKLNKQMKISKTFGYNKTLSYKEINEERKCVQKTINEIEREHPKFFKR